jgi:hypothetical protein
VLQLNPGVALDSLSISPLVLTWWGFYGVHAAAFFYVLIVLRQLFSVEVRSPGWISLRLLATFGTLAVCVAAVVTWLNLGGYRAVLEPATVARMTNGAAVISLCASLCVTIAFAQLILKRRRGWAGSVFAAVVVASLAVPLALRGIAPAVPRLAAGNGPTVAVTPSRARVSMILLDGATLDFIAPNVASGRLPNFGRLLESGAVMHLATLKPTQPAPVWTAVSTGKLPFKTTVYSAARYSTAGTPPRLDLLPDFCFAQALVRFGLLREEERTSLMVRARPLWELLNKYGVTTGVIDWPMTYPATAIDGYLVSDEFLRRDDASLVAAVGDGATAWPPEAVEIARHARLRAVPESTVALVARRAVSRQPGEGQAPLAAVGTDAVAEQLAQSLSEWRPAQFTAVRYPGLDAVGHYYLRYAMPRAFGDVSDAELLEYGRVLEQYYTYVDGIVGRAMAALEADDLLIVVSGFGMEPLSLSKRILERVTGDSDLSGTHERAPDGFLFAYGRSVGKGNFPRASVVDIAPTVLYFLGLPIARDLDGYARTDIFTPAFTEQRPITFIPTY